MNLFFNRVQSFCLTIFHLKRCVIFSFRSFPVCDKEREVFFTGDSTIILSLLSRLFPDFWSSTAIDFKGLKVIAPCIFHFSVFSRPRLIRASSLSGVKESNDFSSFSAFFIDDYFSLDSTSLTTTSMISSGQVEPSKLWEKTRYFESPQSSRAFFRIRKYRVGRTL